MAEPRRVVDDRGSTIPLILGFFLISLLMAAASIAAGTAFVHQRDVQSMCDAAAVAAAAGDAALQRTGDVDAGLRFGAIEKAVDDFLARDPARRGMRATAGVADDGHTIDLRCSQVRKIAFGAVFGRAGGVHHVVHSSARAPTSG